MSRLLDQLWAGPSTKRPRSQSLTGQNRAQTEGWNEPVRIESNELALNVRPTRIWLQSRQSWAGGHRAHDHQDPNVSQATATLTWQEETRTSVRAGRNLER